MRRRGQTLPGRKSEWEEARKGLLGAAGGHCPIVGTGSDIKSDPLDVTDGVTNTQTDVRMDASKCTYHEETELADTYVADGFDPRYSCHQRRRM